MGAYLYDKQTYPFWPYDNPPGSTVKWEGVDPSDSTYGKVSVNGPKPHPLVPHLYSINRNSISWSPCSDRFLSYNDGISTVHHDITGNPTGVIYTRADNYFNPLSSNSAANKVLSKLEGMNTNIATFIGEGHATWKMFGTTALRLAQAARNIRNKDFRGAGRALGFEPSQRGMSRLRQVAKTARNQAELLGNSWLEYQYGWKPLLSDLYGSVAAYRQGVIAPGRVYQLSARLTNQSTFHEERPASIQDAGNTKRFVYNVSFSTTDKAGIQVRVTSPMAATLQQLGLLNPLSLAWELLPYSFVVDWFLPVGSYLGALTSSLGYEVIHSWESHEKKTELVVDAYGGQVFSTLTSYGRSADSLAPNATPLLRLVDGLSGSMSRSASATALLQQAFLRK